MDACPVTRRVTGTVLLRRAARLTRRRVTPSGTARNSHLVRSPEVVAVQLERHRARRCAPSTSGNGVVAQDVPAARVAVGGAASGAASSAIVRGPEVAQGEQAQPAADRACPGWSAPAATRGRSTVSVLQTNASRTSGDRLGAADLDRHRRRPAPLAEVLPQRRSARTAAGWPPARARGPARPSATTSASQPMPGVEGEPPAVGPAESDQPAAARRPERASIVRGGLHRVARACRSARAKTFAEPPGTTASAPARPGPAARPAVRAGRRAARSTTSFTVPSPPCATTQLHPVRGRPARRPRRRARGSGSRSTSSLSSLASAWASTSRPAARRGRGLAG